MSFIIHVIQAVDSPKKTLLNYVKAVPSLVSYNWEIYTISHRIILLYVYKVLLYSYYVLGFISEATPLPVEPPRTVLISRTPCIVQCLAVDEFLLQIIANESPFKLILWPFVCPHTSHATGEL